MLVRRSGPIWLLLASSLAGLAAISGACGGAGPTASATLAPTSTAAPSATASASPSASPSAGPSLSPVPTLPLQHVNAALEDLLPNSIGGVGLQKLSTQLDTYIASSNGGDKKLLAPWPVRFGKTPAQIDMAIATDLTQEVRFFVQAIQVPGAKPAELTAEFARLARQADWPVTGRTVASRAVLEITDPVAEAAGGLATAYVLAVGDVMYIVVTDDPALLVEALIKLPK